MVEELNVFCMWDMNSYRQRADWQTVFTKDDHHNIPYPAGFSHKMMKPSFFSSRGGSMIPIIGGPMSIEEVMIYDF